jgi:hypothetical protein
MACMLGYGATLLSLLLPCAALAQAGSQTTVHTAVSLHATYNTYAAGMHVAEVETGFNFGPWTYQFNLGYHTTGMVGWFFRGHQFDLVSGSWNGVRAEPSRFVGEGSWRGIDREADIGYKNGEPVIRRLIPPNETEREPVPASFQADTIDTLSALAQLIRVVDATGRCETAVHTYDGRRALEIEAHTMGEEVLEPTDRSSFAGKTLRCDFSGRMLAGFLFGDDRERDSRPMRGSAWLAPIVAGGPRVPVRMTFETKWFGDATMYLSGTGPGSDLKVARSD